MAEERDIIGRTSKPATVSSLVGDLRTLGLATGDVAIVHSSLSALGWVAGGPQAVVEALLASVGTAGTIVMPTQSGQLSDPADWSNPPVPRDWVEILRAELPAFDPYLTPTRAMGQIVECFRQHRGTLRSSHPTLSFAACGSAASTIVDDHQLSPAFGETSPLGHLYRLDAKVVLLGVSHANDTSLHLAEHRAVWSGKTTSETGAPVVVDGQRRWVVYRDLDHDEADFESIGEAFAATGRERRSPVGAGIARLCDQPAIVDFATEWITVNRGDSAQRG